MNQSMAAMPEAGKRYMNLFDLGSVAKSSFSISANQARTHT